MKALAMPFLAGAPDAGTTQPRNSAGTKPLFSTRRRSALASATLQSYDMSNRAAVLDGPATGTLAVPVELRGHLVGVVFVDPRTEQGQRFATQQTRTALLEYLGAAIADGGTAATPVPSCSSPTGGEDVLRIRRIGANNSIFVDGHYLIKGVAGAILWKLLTDHSTQGRCEFSTRELRLDPEIQLPDVNDNLGPRLILLKGRLAQHQPHLRIERTSRGRFRLVVTKPFTLVEG